tara:strand:+ start:19 stop:330 length:312 start_codon:yes stop_codon:yes gene_type:complete
MKKILVNDLHLRLKNKKITLLDVREPFELKIASIENSINIPMSEISSRISELDKNEDIAVMCHSGIRSAQVCYYLEQFGFRVYNVEGGIDCWSEKIDNTISRY